jgi:uncharacterized membrane protein YfcA
MAELAALTWPWSWTMLLLALLVAGVAGAVRGFAGFGFSALTVAGLAPFVAPGPVVAAALVLESLASAGMFRSVSGDVDRRWLRSLLIGNLVCVPLGLAALAFLPATPVRILVAGALLCAALAMRQADGHVFASSRRLHAAAGISSGLLNGVAASGGVAAAMLMAATRPPPAVLRATMITFLLYMSVYAMVWAALLSQAGRAQTPLLGADTLRWVLVLAPAMFIGMRIGRRAFGHANPNRYRRFVLDLLIVVSGLGLLSASLAWWRGA